VNEILASKLEKSNDRRRRNLTATFFEQKKQQQKIENQKLNLGKNLS